MIESQVHNVISIEETNDYFQRSEISAFYVKCFTFTTKEGTKIRFKAFSKDKLKIRTSTIRKKI